MVKDPFETLYARYPVNLPEAASVYRDLPDKLLLATNRQVLSEAKTIGFATAGRSATEAARRAKLPASPFRAGSASRSFVLGAASNLMKESDNHIVAATGEVFGFGLAARSAWGLFFGSNLIGGTALLAYEIYGLPDKIDEWQKNRLSAENDLILLHWGSVSRRCKKHFIEICEELELTSKSPVRFWGALSEKARTTLASPAGRQLSDMQRQQYSAAHALGRKQQLAAFAKLAAQANENAQLAILLNRFFTAALNDPRNNERLGASPMYRGLIDDNRARMFAIYAGWFRDLETKLTRYKSLFEDLARLYAWLEPADVGEWLRSSEQSG